MRPLGWNEEILGRCAWAALEKLADRGDFFVTGEAALAGFWLHHRSIRQVELATRGPLDALQRLVEEACGLSPPGEALPGFLRYRLEDGMELDLVSDYEVCLDPEKPQLCGLKADSLRDLAADRVLRLMGPPDPLLLVDLYFLARARLDLQQAARDAALKDLGVTPHALALVLARAVPSALPPGLFRPVELEGLQRFLEDQTARFGMQSYS